MFTLPAHCMLRPSRLPTLLRPPTSSADSCFCCSPVTAWGGGTTSKNACVLLSCALFSSTLLSCNDSCCPSSCQCPSLCYSCAHDVAMAVVAAAAVGRAEADYAKGEQRSPERGHVAAGGKHMDQQVQEPASCSPVCPAHGVTVCVVTACGVACICVGI